jgi:molybdate transport system substrate-binding protein
MSLRWTVCFATMAILPLAFGAATPCSAFASDPVVFAAASLKNALDDVAALYGAKTGKNVTVNYAGSSTLAKQIEQGAPADIFFSANIDWMDYLEERALIDRDSRVTLLGNTIVLVAPADSDAAIEISPDMPLAELLGDGRLAMANVNSVPAGLYGKSALERLGVWDTVAEKIVQADNVRAALAFVANGEAPLGIVYATDAAAEPAVKVLGTFPADSHPPILYPVALTVSSKSPSAADFLHFLKSTAAVPAFTAQGFAVLSPGS